MDNQDINIRIDGMRFNYRVAAVIEYKNKILLQKPSDWKFWNLPGGRVKVNENSLDALKREIKEELGYEFNNFKFIHLAENFFKWQGKQVHELLFIYKIKLSDSDKLTKMNNFSALDIDNMIYKWFDKKKVRNIKCLPGLIYQIVEKEDDEFIHTFGE